MKLDVEVEAGLDLSTFGLGIVASSNSPYEKSVDVLISILWITILFTFKWGRK